ncbi:MAG: GNAT family N-acetyltransferase [Lewinellaceae bacterium]|nr:GNAT family N-acetyltransferase [Lewinellaceae bacterium]
MMICQIEFATPEYDEAVALRYEVLRRPLGLEYTPEQLAGEWDNLHFAAYDAASRMIGYLNLTPVNQSEVKMRQVAVAPAQQNKGIGKALVAYSEMVAKQLNFKEITLHARKTAVPFYLRLGYESIGDPLRKSPAPLQNEEGTKLLIAIRRSDCWVSVDCNNASIATHCRSFTSAKSPLSTSELDTKAKRTSKCICSGISFLAGMR